MGAQSQYHFFPVSEDKFFPPHAMVVTTGAEMHGGFVAMDRLPSNASSTSQVSFSSDNCFSNPSNSASPTSNMSYSPTKYEYENNSVSQQSFDSSASHYFSQIETIRYTPTSLGWTHNTELLKLYRFIVPKGKAPYLELRDNWTPTFETPEKVHLDEPKGYKKNQYPCLYPGKCHGKQNIFTRPADLERHYKQLHADEKDSYPCDYLKCPRSHDTFTRKDHYRDHLKEYHKEDIGCAKAEKGTKSKENGKWQQAQDRWLAERQISAKHFRCARCLEKNYVAQSGWDCFNCKSPCEAERRAARERLMDETTQYPPAADYQNCGACSGSAWVPYNGTWVLCRSCQAPAESYATEEPFLGTTYDSNGFQM